MKLQVKVLFLFALVLLSACAGSMDYSFLERHMNSADCPLAIGYVEQSRDAYGMNQLLLFNLDAATVHMLCGNYEKSNEYFHRAETISEELWTKSISKEAAAFILNDYTVPYAGEDFERALINLFSAINYAMLGDYDEALVECRRLDANLSMFNQKYAEKNVYKEDAFGRYMSGIIYESTGNINDAYIDYFKAYQIYQDYRFDYGTRMPKNLIADLFRAGEATGRTGELSEIDEHREVRGPSFRETREMGKIVLIHLNGKSPVKIDNRVFIATTSGPVTIAFPEYRVQPPPCRGSELLVFSESGHVAVVSELVEDINQIAVKNLDDRKGRIAAKEIARVVVKQGAIDAATQGINDEGLRQMTKIFLNVINIAIERADTRSWRTLPAEIYIARTYLPPGKYGVYVRTCGRQEEVVPFLELKKGETKFVLFDTMY